MDFNKLLQNYNPLIDDIYIHDSEQAYFILNTCFNTKNNIKTKIKNSYDMAVKENHQELMAILVNYHGKVGIKLI